MKKHKSFLLPVLIFTLFPLSVLAAPELIQGPVIEKVSLVEAHSGKVLVDNLVDGSTVNLANVDRNNLNIIVTTLPRKVRKVVFFVNDQKYFEDFASPYALAGDDGGNLKSWAPKLGLLKLNFVPFDLESQVVGLPHGIFVQFVEGLSEVVKPTSSPPISPLPTTSSSMIASPIPSSSPDLRVELSESPTPSPDPVDLVEPTLPETELPELPFDNVLIPVFPGAMGFGAWTVAGSGRNQQQGDVEPRIFKVNNLGASGVGSLNECIQSVGPRICLFEVSGVIKITEAIQITSPYLTIAGQTAPSPGIVIQGAGLQIRTHDVLIQHVSVHVGDAPSGPSPGQRDGVVFWGESSSPVYNVVLDHMSVLWGIDENMSSYGLVSDVTVSNSIIAESLHNSIHPKGPHGKGILVGVGSQRVSLHHNLLAHNHDRNPRINPGASVEFISNVVYNWGGTSGWNVANLSDTDSSGTPTFLNFISNRFIMGADSTSVASIYASKPNLNSKVYVFDNLDPKRTASNQDDWKVSSLPNRHRAIIPPHFLSEVIPTSASDLESAILSKVGSRPGDRLSVDARIISEVKTRKGLIKDCVSGCSRNAGGFMELPINQHSLSVPAAPFLDNNGNGYTNLEDWLWQYGATVD